MNESSKAYRRRRIEDLLCSMPFRWHDDKDHPSSALLSPTLHGLDIGCGNDPYPTATATFDTPDGDANVLHNYFRPATFDWIHASQVLEHMTSPFALLNWLKVLKPGGVAVITVPAWEVYERMIWPSRFNPDHKSSWSLWQKDSHAPCHVHVPSFVSNLPGTEVVLAPRLVDNSFNYKLDPSIDQTFNEADGVEAFIEFAVRKL